MLSSGVRMPLEMLLSRDGAPDLNPVSTLVQLAANVHPKRQWMMAQVPVSLTCMRETRMES